MFTHLVHSLVCLHRLQSIKHSWNLQIDTHTHTHTHTHTEKRRGLHAHFDVKHIQAHKKSGLQHVYYVLVRCKCLLTWWIADFTGTNAHKPVNPVRTMYMWSPRGTGFHKEEDTEKWDLNTLHVCLCVLVCICVWIRLISSHLPRNQTSVHLQK